MKNISNSPQGGCPRREERLRIVQAPVPLLPDPHLVKRPVDEIWVMRSQGPSDLRKNGVALIDTHTGFKFIGDKICEFEETGISCISWANTIRKLRCYSNRSRPSNGTGPSDRAMGASLREAAGGGCTPMVDCHAGAALVATLLVPLLLEYLRSNRRSAVNLRDVPPHRAGRAAPRDAG